MIKIKRIYEATSTQDGYRILVDRLWPRGINKSDACIDEWWKELAPSTGLRVWFGHDLARWDEFTAKYAIELGKNHAALIDRIQKIPKCPVTLVYAAKDDAHNQAVVLQQYIRSKILKLDTTRKQ